MSSLLISAMRDLLGLLFDFRCGRWGLVAGPPRGALVCVQASPAGRYPVFPLRRPALAAALFSGRAAVGGPRFVGRPPWRGPSWLRAATAARAQRSSPPTVGAAAATANRLSHHPLAPLLQTDKNRRSVLAALAWIRALGRYAAAYRLDSRRDIGDVVSSSSQSFFGGWLLRRY